MELYKQQKYPEAITRLQDAIRQEAPTSEDYKESALLIGQSYFMMSASTQGHPVAGKGY